MADKTVDLASAEASKNEESSGYDRSTIVFPYGDLEDALSVADAIYEHAGTSCDVDQLAAWLDHSAKSSTFRLKLSTARIFSLTENKAGRVSLTPLGREAVDPPHRGRAIARSFLSVPLYKRVYDKYKGVHLPPAAALQREMESFGVAKKQTSKARQAFERSAQQAGFFEHGKDRLVEPAFKGGGSPEPIVPPPKPPGRGGGGPPDGLHPFILGLLDSLPDPNSVWPEQDRQKWLQTAENVFSLMYKTEDDPTGGDPTE